MESVFDTLLERGFIQQSTHEDEVRELLAKEKISFYIGFDPTADSLHIGHFIPVMAMAHMQRAGHRPIAVVGGGTGMVGDPTDKTELRRIMTPEEIQHNVDCFKNQLSRFIDFSEDRAIIVNNADWLMPLQYIPFLREYGVHFSVNRMLTADCYRTRYERGLSFFEFNYMIMQSYDFLELYRRYNCKIQMGGKDQWSNIIGGVELIRRVENGSAYGVTFSLLENSDNKKMGKTEKGAVWLDPNKTTPYEFFQYFRNVDDRDVVTCLKLLTFVPIEEIEEVSKLEGSQINAAKEKLAFEVTKIVHGEEEAVKALNAAKALFAGKGEEGSIPTTEVKKADVGSGVNVIDLLIITKLVPSKSEGRRVVTQGGLKVNDAKIDSLEHVVTLDDFTDGSLLIQKGKKSFHRVKVVD